MTSDPGPALAEDIESFPLSLANYSYTGHNHQPVLTLTLPCHGIPPDTSSAANKKYIDSPLRFRRSHTCHLFNVKRDMSRWHEQFRSVNQTLTMHAAVGMMWLWQSQCPTSWFPHVFLNANYPALVSAPVVWLWQLLWSFTQPVLLLLLLLLRCALDGRECGCVCDASDVVLLTRLTVYSIFKWSPFVTWTIVHCRMSSWIMSNLVNNKTDFTPGKFTTQQKVLTYIIYTFNIFL